MNNEHVVNCRPCGNRVPKLVQAGNEFMCEECAGYLKASGNLTVKLS